MTAVPDHIKALADAGETIGVTWERDDTSTKVIVELQEATITVETGHDDESGVENIPWLVQALPNILETAWAAIEAEDALEEGSSEEEEQ